VIVFTEYRDTLERLHEALRAQRGDISILQGAMTAAERTAAQSQFNDSGTLLLATDAAAEGLNLHRRCRTVIHFELPWSPTRLEQRTGRVDRIGQARVVHEIILIADDTAERMVLAPLAQRARRAASFGSTGPGLLNALSESRIAAAVMSGAALESSQVSFDTEIAVTPEAMRTDARREADRLSDLRRWNQRSTGETRGLAVPVTAVRTSRSDLAPGVVHVYTLNLSTAGGDIVHSEIVALREENYTGRLTTAHQVRTAALSFLRRIEDTGPPILNLFRHHIEHFAQSCTRVATALSDRERIVSSTSTSAARQLVQAGLFDRRALQANDAQRERESSILDERDRRLAALGAQTRLIPSLNLQAILFVAGRGRS
jgi:hypothetical protein